VPYRYDIFISYRRQKFQDEWLTEHFLKTFDFYVSEEVAGVCGRETTIFFDQLEVNPAIRTGTLCNGSGIEPGDNWKNALERAIKTSRCLLGLWSPMYFLSPWCNTEWRSFAYRPTTPLVASSVYDGSYFPPDARGHQEVDLNDFVQVGRGLIDGAKSSEFHARVKLLAQAVAVKVRDAPHFDQWWTSLSNDEKDNMTLKMRDPLPFGEWPIVADNAPAAPDPAIPLTTLAHS
jgi:hypothetical protein